MGLVLITGGGSLLGAAIAAELAGAGRRVLLTDIDLALAEEVVAGLPHRERAEAARLDVTDRGEVAAVVAEAASRPGGITALVNGAGGGRGIGVPLRDFVEFSEAERDKLIAVNLYGVLNMCQAVLPHMTAAGGGAIVSIVAARGLKGGPKASIYSASKAAVIAFSQSLAEEVGRHKVRVNTVAPGSTPARWKSMAAERVRSPLGRPTSPEDVGAAVAFLLSDAAAHVTGSCLDVSGGTALH